MKIVKLGLSFIVIVTSNACNCGLLPWTWAWGATTFSSKFVLLFYDPLCTLGISLHTLTSPLTADNFCYYLSPRLLETDNVIS